MIGALKEAWANFRGFDTTGTTVPPMDGPLRPNARLDAAPLLLAIADVDNLTATPAGLLASVGAEIHQLAGEGDALRIAATRTMPGMVTAMASTGSSLAIAVAGAGIQIEAEGAAPRMVALDGIDAGHVTAMSFAGPATLYVAIGSARHPAREWKRDLMTKTVAGSVLRLDLVQGRTTVIARDLAFPSGILASGGRVFVSEAWRHRVLSLGADGGKPEIVLGGLPAYPGRIAPSSAGGFWLAMFAPRNPLVEFVLKEKDYRRRMVETIDPDYWIAPSLATGRSFLEPIQGGARKKLNMLKPWSPTWSTGLVVRCGSDMAMLESWHSRADGAVHGITSLTEMDGRLMAGARGSGKIVALDSIDEGSAA